jgi:hypothetical protein
MHFIAMAGLHGCLPNYCEVFPDRAAAIESLADLHELGKRRTSELRQTGYLTLSLHRDGNEYAEIVECACPTPWIHSDSQTEADWQKEQPKPITRRKENHETDNRQPQDHRCK